MLRLAALAVVAAGSLARAQAAPELDVTLGPAVKARFSDLGRSDLEAERDAMQRTLASMVASSAHPPAAVHLVIEDIEPNRATSHQLGLSPNLSATGTFGLGGAAITGEVVAPGGASLPVRYRSFQSDLRFEQDFTTWGEADRAFDTVARSVAQGRPLDDGGQWPPPHRPQTPTGSLLR